MVLQRDTVLRLVYYELHENMLLAIQREKQIKKWNRAWKLELIEKHNSDWSDLWPAIVWIPAFARMTEDAINVAPLRTKAKREIQEWLTSSIQNPKFKSVWLT